MLLDVFDQSILILAHFEEIVVFAELFHRAFAIGAQPVSDILLSPKPFIKCAVPSNIIIFINQLLVIKTLKVSLNDRLVRRICRPDEGIVGNI